MEEKTKEKKRVQEKEKELKNTPIFFKEKPSELLGRYTDRYVVFGK